MKKILFSLAFVLLWSGWYFGFPYLLVWMEGFSFFTTLPDYISLNFSLPRDMSSYVGAFLLQFYSCPAAGAAIQALLPMLVISSLAILIGRLFKDGDTLTWISFLPLPVLIYYQMKDMTLVVSVSLAVISLGAALLVSLLTLARKGFVRLPSFFHSIYLTLPMFAVIVGASASVMFDEDSTCNRYEDVAYLEYLAENDEWDEILKSVSGRDAVANGYKRRYALLALSQTGDLPDQAFRYGLSSVEDFLFYNEQMPFSLNFNIQFYRCLGMSNLAIYHTYQQAVQPVYGMTFDALRYLTDLYLEIGDYRLAKKYMDILAGSTCHGRWLEKRQWRLSQIKGTTPDYSYVGKRFTMESFLPDMSAMYDRYPQNRKLADYLLCGVLAERDGNSFYRLFHIISANLYEEKGSIPRLYQEALLLVAGKNPSVLQKYKIDKDVWDGFVDFTDLRRSGKIAEARNKYADTYWAYVY